MSKEKNRVFPPMLREDKADQATRVTREIVERDRVASETKTAKLKALRLARDTEAALNAPPAVSPKKGRR